MTNCFGGDLPCNDKIMFFRRGFRSVKENPIAKIEVKEIGPKERAALKAAAKKAMPTSEGIRE